MHLSATKGESVVNRKLFVLVAVIFALRSEELHAGDGSVRRVARPARDQYIVVFKPQIPGSNAAIANELANAHGARIRYVFGLGFAGFSFEGMRQAAEAMSRDPRVAYVEENSLVLGLQQVAPVSPPGWAHDRISQASLPLDHIGIGNCVNGGVRIYVVDTGINDPTGAEFGSRLIDLWSKVPGQFRDAQGHGTKAASLAGGNTYGVSRTAPIINVRALVDGSTDTADELIAGITAINQHHAQQSPASPAVVSMSLMYPASTAIDDAIRNSMAPGGSVAANGLTYVVAAGNAPTDFDTCSAGSPGRLGAAYGSSNPYPYSTITVGATMLLGPNYDTDARLAPSPDGAFSGTGQCVDIFAPGYENDALDYVTGQPTLFSHTSAATPLVAGEVARRLTKLPTYTSIDIENSIKTDASAGQIQNVGTGPNLLLRYLIFRCRTGS